MFTNSRINFAVLGPMPTFKQAAAACITPPAVHRDWVRKEAAAATAVLAAEIAVGRAQVTRQGAEAWIDAEIASGA